MSPTKSHFTEEELELLSPEEREGLLDETLVDDDVEDIDAAVEDAPAAVVPDKAPEPTPAAEPVPVAAEPAATVAIAPAPAADPVAPAPSAARIVTAPADINEQINATRQAQRDLAAKFDAGDLTAVEYEAQRTTLEDKVLDLRDLRSRATESFDQRRHTWENDTVANFLTTNANIYDGEGSSSLLDALDLAVRRLQVGEFKADPFDPRIIAKAHDQVMASFRKVNGAAPDPKPGDTPKPKPAREIPPNIGGLPAVGEDEIGTDGGAFAYLDRLMDKNPLEYERQFAALTDAQREAYLAAG